MSKSNVTIYTPESVFRHPSRFFRSTFNDLRRSHALGWRLAVRDLNALYRQTALGFLWALILPLGNAATWLLMRNAGIVNTGDTGIPYALYVFIGTLLWGIFVDAVNAPVQQAVSAKPLLAKVNFPPESLVIAGAYQVGVAALIKMTLIVAATFASGYAVSAMMWFLPLGIAALILLGTALGLLLTPVGLLYTDVAKSLPLMTQFLMYLTPVVYAAPTSGWMARAMHYNPITPILATTRNWAVGSAGDMGAHFSIVMLGALALLTVMWAAYKAAMPILVERMGP